MAVATAPSAKTISPTVRARRVRHHLVLLCVVVAARAVSLVTLVAEALIFPVQFECFSAAHEGRARLWREVWSALGARPGRESRRPYARSDLAARWLFSLWRGLSR